MAEKTCIHVILPCFNEEEGLEELLARFKRVVRISGRDFRFIVVNDGSSDHSREVAQSFAEELPLEVIDFHKNKGVTEVFNEAFSHVMRTGASGDLIITTDSDNTMNPYTMLDIIDELGTHDVVIASRFAKGGGMVGVGPRAILSHGASWLMKKRIGIPGVSDYSIFYRGYRFDTIKTLFDRLGDRPVAGKGFACMANFLIQIHRNLPETKFHEVPLVLNYYRKMGQSGIRIFRTIRGYLELAFPKN